MSRIKFAAAILRPLCPKSILDVGCRDASLLDEFPIVPYAGADLVPDKLGRVKYIGDITEIDFDRRFDTVVALDILEHLDRPGELFDRLVALADRLILVSLPNTYDLKSRVMFVRGQLGGKYEFCEDPPADRHRWLMNRNQIVAFYEAKAARHDLSFQEFDLTYGASMNSDLTARCGRVLAKILPPSMAAETIFGLFSKQSR